MIQFPKQKKLQKGRRDGGSICPVNQSNDAVWILSQTNDVKFKGQLGEVWILNHNMMI